MSGDISPFEEEKTEPASVEKDQTALPQPPQESADTPQAADKITGSSARESQNSSVQSHSGGSVKNSSSLQPNNNLNIKKSLLTSTGCGPDGSRASEIPKMTQPIKVPKKVDHTAHITKFSSSLVFNAIERVTKAGSELIVRQDPENPIQ